MKRAGARAESKMNRAIRLYIECEGVCYLCGESLGEEYSDLMKFYKQMFRHVKGKPRLRRSKININEDHVVPKARGGACLKENRRLTHMICNTRKGSLTYEEYLYYHGKDQNISHQDLEDTLR